MTIFFLRFRSPILRTIFDRKAIHRIGCNHHKQHQTDSYGSHCTKPTDASGRFRKPQAKFLVTLFSTILIVCGRVNFTHLSRYSNLSERTYRRQFEQRFDFTRFNAALVRLASENPSEWLAVMDCSFVAKSGKATFGIDRFWNGCASRVETGLEVSVVAVVNVETRVSYALSAHQTFAQGMLPSFTRLDPYLHQLDCVQFQLPSTVRYLAVDGAYAKAAFVSGAIELKLPVISKLRCDANLRYLHTGPQKPQGRKRK